jgi:hypothetical protein
VATIWHAMIEILCGLVLVAVGFAIGGTIAWYKGWDEGFREGFGEETRERLKRMPKSPRMRSAH